MTKNWCGSLAVASLMVVAGCSHNSPSSTEPAKQETAESQPVLHPAPEGTPFAKIKEGMSTDEVTGLIGRPDAVGGYVTGKAFIPFHYGGDTHRTIYRYKGQGTIIFSSNGRFSGGGMGVLSVDYDPNETGKDQ
ncbi:MAG TPA: hypothetical protein VIM11_20780 [Tepidisphaeraceae bacterium]|jgi:hypothetical protein